MFDGGEDGWMGCLVGKEVGWMGGWMDGRWVGNYLGVLVLRNVGWHWQWVGMMLIRGRGSIRPLSAAAGVLTAQPHEADVDADRI